MKKIALCSLLVCLGSSFAYGANQCKTSITFSPANNNWNAGSDEYLFETKRDYLNAVNTGYVYECDSNWCTNDTYVELPAGHVFDGKTVREPAKYKCSEGWGKIDKWEKVDKVDKLTRCTKQWHWESDFGIDKKLSNVEDKSYLYPTVTDFDAMKGRVYAQVYECDNSVCADGTIITLPKGHVFGRKDVNKERKYKCVLGDPGNDKWVDITDDCEDCNKKKPETKQCTYEGKKYNVNAKIKDGVPCSGAATADAKTGETCYLTCMQKLENKGGAIEPLWTVKECSKGAKAIEYSLPEQIYTSNIPGYKKCEGKGGGSNINPTQPNEPVAPAPVVPDGNCEYHFHGTVYCASGISMNIDKRYPVSETILNGKSCSEFNKMYENDLNIVLSYFEQLCDGASLTPVDARLAEAQESLRSFFEYSDSHRSGLKTAEGKFNTVRLASDLTAGVVLGTVGGVVSGVVIKKKQVEKGFEALHCTVGGQTIADWGDTFEVGLQK